MTNIKMTAELRRQIREARSEKRRAEIGKHLSAYRGLDNEMKRFKVKK